MQAANSYLPGDLIEVSTKDGCKIVAVRKPEDWLRLMSNFDSYVWVIWPDSERPYGVTHNQIIRKVYDVSG